MSQKFQSSFSFAASDEAHHISALLELRNWYMRPVRKVLAIWISLEPVAWPWCNVEGGQRRPYCATVNSHSPVRLVSRQWEAVNWACVLFDRRIHKDRTSRPANLHQCACPFCMSRAGFLGKTSHHRGLSAPLQRKVGSLRLLVFPKVKIAFESEEICECDGHTVHKRS